MIGVSPLSGLSFDVSGISGFGVGPGRGIRFEGSGCLPWYALFLKRHITVSVAYAYREPLRNSSRMAPLTESRQAHTSAELGARGRGAVQGGVGHTVGHFLRYFPVRHRPLRCSEVALSGAPPTPEACQFKAVPTTWDCIRV